MLNQTYYENPLWCRFFSKLNSSAVTTGTFDGVHLGHKKILQKLCSISTKNGLESVLLTFAPHPRLYLFPDNNLKLINSREENLSLFEDYGLNHVVFLTFDKSLSRLTYLDYVRDILIKKIGMKHMVVGYDHQFGRNREGSIESLNEISEIYSFETYEVNPVFINNHAISSTKIRNYIEDGELEKANKYLGHNFTLFGSVINGNGKGKELGFPTANVKILDKNKIIPRDGVYAVYIHYNGNLYEGMMNIGPKPTFDLNDKSIEVNIFDFSQDIYNKNISVEVIKRLRSVKKFKSINDLKLQIEQDKILSLNVLNIHKKHNNFSENI